MLYLAIAALTVIALYFAYHCDRLSRTYSTGNDLYKALLCFGFFAAAASLDAMGIIILLT